MHEEPGALPPPLKWAGGKRWLVPLLAVIYAPHRDLRLVEPFVGGMAVALGLRPDRALLADANPHVIALYRHLSRGLRVTLPMRNDRAAYYAARERFNALLREGRGDSAEAAQLFYYLNRTGYNGLCRFNARGELNVPFGSYRAIRYARGFEEYAPLLARWELRCCRFEAIDAGPGDFVYADPPYDVEFTRYSKEGFAWPDQVTLADWLALREGPVVASNQATPRILALYRERGFRVETRPAPRRIACNGDRTPALEMIATRNLGDALSAAGGAPRSGPA
ncbi:MAG: Dam family site-specific DNA-(adenine-N6)-methyltransferase [Chthonomonadales bacterium]|nr:Dam family site-specific DNA-(adenine-N6)-methyltransferase [Chthonomonadales bacterium]